MSVLCWGRCWGVLQQAESSLSDIVESVRKDRGQLDARSFTKARPLTGVALGQIAASLIDREGVPFPGLENVKIGSAHEDHQVNGRPTVNQSRFRSRPLVIRRGWQR